MIGSKLVPVISRLGRNNGTRMFSTTLVKNGDGPIFYRFHAPPDKFRQNYATACGAIFWGWIWWNIFTNYEVVTGHFPWVDSDEWTDAELGIPPDDAADPEI